MKLPKFSFQMMKRQFVGLGILGLVVLVVYVGIYFFKNQEKEKSVMIEFVDEIAPAKAVLFEFNPNDLSAEGWQNLGFSEKQAQIILKYKNSVGGMFTSREQLAKCYAISSKKFAEIEPFILPFEIKNEPKKFSFRKRKLNISRKFNPDDYTQKDWENLGYSEKQAHAILRYKNYLGGSFRSKEKFRECFIIGVEEYQQIAPYLLLPEKEKKEEKTVFQSKIQYTYFDPNFLDLEGWKKLGFSEKQSQVILNYKERNLRGNFKTLEDVQRCFVISEDKFLELKPWIKINEEELAKNSVEPQRDIALLRTNFSEIDINQITFGQLVEFGFGEKSAASFLRFREKLGGFVEKSQVLETYLFPLDLAKKLLEICPLDNSKIQKYSLRDVPEYFLKTHPYFRKYGEKIIFYRITFSEEKEIFRKIKATSREVAKMKLYLQ